MHVINLYTSVPTSAEVLRAAHELRAGTGRAVVLRPLAELPAPKPAGARRHWLLEKEQPGAGPAPAPGCQEGGVELG